MKSLLLSLTMKSAVTYLLTTNVAVAVSPDNGAFRLITSEAWQGIVKSATG